MPVEHRLLGLDKRSFPYALFVVAVFLVATVRRPAGQRRDRWDDPVRAGEQLALSDTIAFTPATGWNVESGFRVGEGGSAVTSGEATVAGDGVTFDVVPDTFDGTPAELLDQIEKVTSATGDPTFQVDGDPATITTPAGDVGVIQTYSSVNGDGLVAAFVIDGTGLEDHRLRPPGPDDGRGRRHRRHDRQHPHHRRRRERRMSSHDGRAPRRRRLGRRRAASGRRPGGLRLGRAVRLRPAPQPLLLGLPVAHRRSASSRSGRTSTPRSASTPRRSRSRPCSAACAAPRGGCGSGTSTGGSASPSGLVVAGLVWGAIPATFAFAMTVNTAMLGIYPKLFGQDWSRQLGGRLHRALHRGGGQAVRLHPPHGPGAAAGPHRQRRPGDRRLHRARASPCSRTSSTPRNSTATAFGTDPVGNAVQMSFTRIAVSFVSHPLFSALVCSGVVYLLGTAAQPRRIGRGIAFVLAGMFLHFTWDDAGGLGGGNGLATFGVMFASIVLGFTVLTHRLPPRRAPRAPVRPRHPRPRGRGRHAERRGARGRPRQEGAQGASRSRHRTTEPRGHASTCAAPSSTSPTTSPTPRAPTPRPSSTPGPRWPGSVLLQPDGRSAVRCLDS